MSASTKQKPSSSTLNHPVKLDLLPCGCQVSERKGKWLRWLLGKKWYWLFDLVHGDPTNVKLLRDMKEDIS